MATAAIRAIDLTLEMRPVASIVFVTIGRVSVLFAVCVAFEFHWVALQSLAWTTMLMTNACHVPLSEAVSRTFDGVHPCQLCHAVSAAQKSEKKSQATPSTGNIDLVCTVRTLNLGPGSADYSYRPVSFQITEHGLSPPVPPPRFANA